MPALAALEKRIGYRFSDPALLKQALTHPSMNTAANNQRLEFLGDSILSAVVAELLYAMFPDEAEGHMARRLAGLVRGEALAEQALALKLDEALILSAGEETAGGRKNPSNLEDAFEALIGAMFLDGGYDAARNFLMPRWKELAASEVTPPKDAKTSLQEWAQAHGKKLPAYRVVETSGLAHSPVFTIEVEVQGLAPQQATAASKRVAEQQAAEKLLSTAQKKKS